MKLLKILCLVFLAVAMFRFMRQMWVTAEGKKATPAQLIASVKTIAPPDRDLAAAPTPAPLQTAASPAIPPSSSPLPSISPTPAGLAPLGRAPLQAPTPKPKATPFLDKDGNPRKAAASP
jgi:hypothetical protein